MKKKSKLLRATPYTAALLSTTLWASAADQSYSPAEVCTLQEGTSALFGSQGQIQNSGATNQTAFCGVGQEQGADSNDDVLVHFHDGTGSSSFNCSVVENSNDWSWVTNGDQKWGCSTVGGCSVAAPNAFTGQGYVRLVDVSHGGNLVTTVTCSVPFGASQIRSLTLDEQL